MISGRSSHRVRSAAAPVYLHPTRVLIVLITGQHASRTAYQHMRRFTPLPTEPKFIVEEATFMIGGRLSDIIRMVRARKEHGGYG